MIIDKKLRNAELRKILTGFGTTKSELIGYVWNSICHINNYLLRMGNVIGEEKREQLKKDLHHNLHVYLRMRGVDDSKLIKHMANEMLDDSLKIGDF